MAIGLERGADADGGGGDRAENRDAPASCLSPIPALVVDLPAGVSLRGIRGIRYVEPTFSRRLALTPTDPLAPRQWYIAKSRFYEPG